MKRIVTTIAILALSTSGAIANSNDEYGSVLHDQPAPYKVAVDIPETSNDNYGSVLLDQVSRNSGLNREMGIGDLYGSVLNDIDASF